MSELQNTGKIENRLDGTTWYDQDYVDNLQQENKQLKELKYKFFDNCGDEESFTLEDYLEISNKLYDYEEENKQLKEELETILDFDYFKNECPLNIGFGDELENKAQDVFYEDEYCESCKDDYRTCWLKYFKKLQELKEEYK